MKEFIRSLWVPTMIGAWFVLAFLALESCSEKETNIINPVIEHHDHHPGKGKGHDLWVKGKDCKSAIDKQNEIIDSLEAELKDCQNGWSPGFNEDSIGVMNLDGKIRWFQFDIDPIDGLPQTDG